VAKAVTGSKIVASEDQAISIKNFKNISLKEGHDSKSRL
jgi:hypothetical protein